MRPRGSGWSSTQRRCAIPAASCVTCDGAPVKFRHVRGPRLEIVAVGSFLGPRRSRCVVWPGLRCCGEARSRRRRCSALRSEGRRRLGLRGGGASGMRWVPGGVSWRFKGGRRISRRPRPGGKARREFRRARRGRCARKGTTLTRGPGQAAGRERRERWRAGQAGRWA